MNKEMLTKEIKATKETISNLEDIKNNTLEGLEINRFVLSKLEEEFKKE